MGIKQTLRKGSKGQTVKELQKLLNKLLSPSPKLTVDGDFGKNSYNAVRLFQKQAGIKIDGVVGDNSWTALAMMGNKKIVEIKKPLPQSSLADIAAKYIGVRETGKNKAGTSKKLLEIFEADDLIVNGKTDGYAWCAAFVSLCVQKLCKKSSYFRSITPPRQAKAFYFLTRWAKKNNCLIFSTRDDIKANAVKGDIVVFTFSHIGIIESNNGEKSTTIEGNTNSIGSRDGGGVERKNRSPHRMRAIIRLPTDPVTVEGLLTDFMAFC